MFHPRVAPLAALVSAALLCAACQSARRPLVIDSVSTEGIAEWLLETFDPMVRQETGGRAWVRQIILHEDTKNKASYQPKA